MWRKSFLSRASAPPALEIGRYSASLFSQAYFRCGDGLQQFLDEMVSPYTSDYVSPVTWFGNLGAYSHHSSSLLSMNELYSVNFLVQNF